MDFDYPWFFLAFSRKIADIAQLTRTSIHATKQAVNGFDLEKRVISKQSSAMKRNGLSDALQRVLSQAAHKDLLPSLSSWWTLFYLFPNHVFVSWKMSKY